MLAVVYFCVSSAALTGGIIRINVSSTAPRRNVQRKQGESPLQREECVLEMTSSDDSQPSFPVAGQSLNLYFYIFMTECCPNYLIFNPQERYWIFFPMLSFYYSGDGSA